MVISYILFTQACFPTPQTWSRSRFLFHWKNRSFLFTPHRWICLLFYPSFPLCLPPDSELCLCFSRRRSCPLVPSPCTYRYALLFSTLGFPHMQSDPSHILWFLSWAPTCSSRRTSDLLSIRVLVQVLACEPFITSCHRIKEFALECKAAVYYA